MLKRFKDAFASNYANLFKNLRDTGSIWDGLTDAEASALSEDYFYHSYDKLLNRKASAWFDDDPTTFLSKVVSTCLARFASNWDKVFQSYFKAVYSPVDDYGYKETRTPDLEVGSTTNTASKITSTTNGKDFGFNSNEPVPTSEVENTTEGTGEENESTTTTTSTGTETIEREGRNGSHTAQELLEEEIRLRGFDYFKKVFEDIDGLICINIY